MAERRGEILTIVELNQEKKSYILTKKKQSCLFWSFIVSEETLLKSLHLMWSFTTVVHRNIKWWASGNSLFLRQSTGLFPMHRVRPNNTAARLMLIGTGESLRRTVEGIKGGLFPYTLCTIRIITMQFNRKSIMAQRDLRALGEGNVINVSSNERYGEGVFQRQYTVCDNSQ